MINLGLGEKILKAFEIKKSFHGKGVFYITNFRVCLETQMHGMILDLPFEILRTYKNTGRDSFRIEWEQDDHRLYYKFKVQGSAKEVFNIYAVANKEFSQFISESNAVKQRYFEYRRQDERQTENIL